MNPKNPAACWIRQTSPPGPMFRCNHHCSVFDECVRLTRLERLDESMLNTDRTIFQKAI